MKKLLALVLATLLVAALVACGPKTSQNGENATNGPESTTSASSQGGQTDAAQNETIESSSSNSGDITVEGIMNHGENAAEDFVVVDHGNGVVELLEYNGFDDIVVIPESWNGKKITTISSYVFGSNSTVKAIKIPDSVTLIDQFAFALNENLEVVIFGSGVREIGNYAFQSCINLHELILNDGLEKIGEISVGDCQSLKRLVIPESVVYIDIIAFYGCPSDFVLVGKAGSVAETYAKDNGITFEAN